MKKGLLLLVGAIALIGFVFVLYILSLFRPVAQGEFEAVSFVIPKGQAISIIANRLAEENLIRSPIAFRIVVKKDSLENKLQAGSFSLSPAMSVSEIAHEMTQGTNDVWVTIPEGLRREEIAELIAEQDLPEFDEDEFLTLSAGQEGKLFPDTYLVAKQSTAETIYNILSNTFEERVVEGLAEEIEDSDYTLNEILTMASIVEREGRGYNDMRHVASILWNRFEIGMALQADATLQYAKGQNKQTGAWWDEPLAVDKQLDSPFNTYQNPGLPPRPISNPGLDAIKATLNPLNTDDLFYLHDPQGGIHYAQTLEEHNANINRYLR
jgi:UPF0755 protein